MQRLFVLIWPHWVPPLVRLEAKKMIEEYLRDGECTWDQLVGDEDE